MTDRLQRGIYHRSGERPPPAYRLVILNAVQDAPSPVVRNGLAEIWTMLADLAQGRVRELVDQPDAHFSASQAQFAGLDALMSFGSRFFDGELHRPKLTAAERPPYLAYLDPQSPFPSLAWTSQRSPGEGDVALQFTGHSSAAVNCASVEVWKLIEDEGLAFEVVTSYDGFSRPDGRGWLEFHDGVSNMDSAMRSVALVAGDEIEWMRGGTYMAFLRIRVDLAAWRSLGASGQEIALGRDKLTGAALESIRQGPSGELIPVSSPFGDDSPEARAAWRDPPQQVDPRLEESHIHRANQSRASPAAPGSFRMFRQGYEFLHDLSFGDPKLGLNFVSFQRDLRSFQHVMNLPGWLGDSTFGGSAPVTLLSLEAGGLYAVPPFAEPFPGADLFDD